MTMPTSGSTYQGWYVFHNDGTVTLKHVRMSDCNVIYIVCSVGTLNKNIE
jgi:hypothetical protein